MDLSIEIEGIHFKNPIVTASGPLGFGDEFFKYISPSVIGGFTSKTVTPKPITGNMPPRLVYIQNGLLNSIGLQNPGVDLFIQKTAPFLSEKCVRIISVGGENPQDFADVTKKVEKFADMIEVNLSCPNVGGKVIASDSQLTKEILSGCKAMTKKPLIAKLSLDLDTVRQSQIAIDSGIKIVNIGNSIQGARFNFKTGKPFLKNVKGGLSGPAFMPIALWKVYQVKEAFEDLTVIGLGGVTKAEDVMEYAIAGASIVEIGTQAMIDPKSIQKIIEDLKNMLEALKLDFKEVVNVSHRGGFR